MQQAWGQESVPYRKSVGLGPCISKQAEGLDCNGVLASIWEIDFDLRSGYGVISAYLFLARMSCPPRT